MSFLPGMAHGLIGASELVPFEMLSLGSIVTAVPPEARSVDVHCISSGADGDDNTDPGNGGDYAGVLGFGVGGLSTIYCLIRKTSNSRLTEVRATSQTGSLICSTSTPTFVGGEGHSGQQGSGGGAAGSEGNGVNGSGGIGGAGGPGNPAGGPGGSGGVNQGNGYAPGGGGAVNNETPGIGAAGMIRLVWKREQPQ